MPGTETNHYWTVQMGQYAQEPEIVAGRGSRALISFLFGGRCRFGHTPGGMEQSTFFFPADDLDLAQDSQSDHSSPAERVQKRPTRREAFDNLFFFGYLKREERNWTLRFCDADGRRFDLETICGIDPCAIADTPLQSWGSAIEDFGRFFRHVEL